MEQRSPRNTAQDPTLAKLAVGLDPAGRGIEAQEAAGQRELLNSTALPAESIDDRADFEALGFTFGDPVPGDPLFVDATLPQGWTREGSNHAMHSYLCDERGVRRVNVFYKAAFYDRRADMHIMNVGYDHVTKAIYGDDDVTLDGRLTADELADVRDAVESYLERAKETPHIYGDRRPRAERLLELLTEAEHLPDRCPSCGVEGPFAVNMDDPADGDLWADHVERCTRPEGRVD